MVGALAVRWLLTVVFAGAVLGSVPVRGRGHPARAAHWISAGFHAAMCGTLIVMAWRSESALPVWFQGTLFGCAVIWFGLANPAPAARGLAGLHHALMAGGMIWMITAMPAAMPMVSGGPGHGAMPAMPRSARPAAVLVVSVLLAGYFALAAIPWFMQAIGHGPRVNDRAAAGHAAMSAGMAAMLLAIL
jgi:hypothetical protein